MNETILSIYNELHIDNNYESISLNAIANSSSRYLKDLKLNLLSLSQEPLLAVQEGANQEEIAEIHACTSLMNANNVLYRFRHWLPDNTYYNNTSAGMRMSIMMNPILGKEFFELVSLVISAINGCEMCVTSHENSVKQHGASEARIYDAIRLGSVIKSFTAIL